VFSDVTVRLLWVSLVLHVYGGTPPEAVKVTVSVPQPKADVLVGSIVREEVVLCRRTTLGYSTGLFLSSATSIGLPFCEPYEYVRKRKERQVRSRSVFVVRSLLPFTPTIRFSRTGQESSPSMPEIFRSEGSV